MLVGMHALQRWLCAATLALLASCGGGDPAALRGDGRELLGAPPVRPPAGQVLALELAAAAQVPAQAGAASVELPDFFRWAELRFPALFPGPQISRVAGDFVFRYYPGTDLYLAVRNGTVHALGPVATAGQLLDLGPLDFFAAPVQVLAAVRGQGELLGAMPVNTVALADFARAASDPDSRISGIAARYPVANYRLTYFTVDGTGRQVAASGLVSVPVKAAGTASPVLSYQHATTFVNAEAPSLRVLPSEPPVVLASQGAIVVAADYVGFAASNDRPHPYLLSAPSAAVVVDLLTAAATWREINGVPDNGQLMLVGYSEGGYATLAAHRALQEGSTRLRAQLRGSVPGGGPYNVQLTLDRLLDRVRDESRLLAALIDPGFLRYLGTSVRNEVRRALLRLLVPDDADVAYQSTFLDNYLADDTAAIERDSNVDNWRPETPVHLYHSPFDQTVPYAVSAATLAKMRARGSGQVSLTDCSAPVQGHKECVPEYFGFTLGIVRQAMDGW